LISDLLAASPRFCELWRAREVAPYDEEHKTIEHPELGLLQLHCDIVRHEGLRVVVFTAPAGSSSAKALIAAQSLALGQMLRPRQTRSPSSLGSSSGPSATARP
jgi:MmyB-like transcription regulator ligand binding domain